MYIVIFYDVPAKRTHLFHKKLGCYLNWMQNSVFAGDLTAAKYKKLRQELKELIEENDHLAFVSTENRHNIEVETVSGKTTEFDDSHQGSGVL